MSPDQPPKHWVLTTSPDFTRNGVLQLGQLLADPFDPASAILARGVIPPPDDVLRDQPKHQIVDFGSHEHVQASFRAWLKLTSQGAEVDFSRGAETWQRYQSSAIEIDMYQPDDEYAETVIGAARGQRNVAIPWYKWELDLFLVTGLRTFASGTQVDVGFKVGNKHGAHIQGDATPAGVPAQVGAALQSQDVAGHHQVIGDASEFIYAYRLHKIIKHRVGLSSVHPWGEGQLHSVQENRGGGGFTTGLDFKPSMDESDAGYSFHHDDSGGLRKDESHVQEEKRSQEFDYVTVPIKAFDDNGQDSMRFVE